MLGARRLTRALAPRTLAQRFIQAGEDVHFRASNIPHPLKTKPSDQLSEEELANKFGRQQNHIWTQEELKEKMSVVYHHKPQSISDHVMRTIMTGLCKSD